MAVSNLRYTVTISVLRGTKFESKGPIGEGLLSRTTRLIRRLEERPKSEDTTCLIKMLGLSKRRNESGLHEYALSLACEYLGEPRNSREKPRSRRTILLAADTLIGIIETLNLD